VNRRAAPDKALVAAIGNPDRGDDGVAALVARRLAGRLPEGVGLVVRSADLVSLIDAFAGLDALLCVDAVAPIAAPGRIHRIDVSLKDLPREILPVSSHACGLSETLALARTLGTLPGKAIVYGIEGLDFGVGAPMTPAVAAAAEEAADRILAEFSKGSPGGHAAVSP